MLTSIISQFIIGYIFLIYYRYNKSEMLAPEGRNIEGIITIYFPIAMASRGYVVFE